MKSRVVIYHRADFDGIFCREIAKKFLGDSADYIGWDRGDPIPEIPLEVTHLYILDLSIRELMGHPALIWIDHHKTAIEEFPAEIHGYRIDGVAACRLTWQWFNEPLGCPPFTKLDFVDRKVEEPLAVRLAGEYDIWDKRDDRAALFQFGLRSQEVDFQRLLNTHPVHNYVYDLLEAGSYVRHASQDGQAYLMAQGAFDLRFEGLLFLAINAAVRNSDAFASKVRPEHDGCLSFVWLPAANKWKVSLRGVEHKQDVDLSVIATKHGGGGHKKTCGFMCVLLPFTLSEGSDYLRAFKINMGAEVVRLEAELATANALIEEQQAALEGAARMLRAAGFTLQGTISDKIKAVIAKAPPHADTARLDWLEKQASPRFWMEHDGPEVRLDVDYGNRNDMGTKTLAEATSIRDAIDAAKAGGAK